MFLSHSSAASPFNGEALIEVSAVSGQIGIRDSLIGLTKQALQTQENGLDVVRCSPLVLQDIQADSSREIDIGVVDWGLEENRGSSVGVVGWESKGELECKTRVRSIFRSLYRRSPGEETTVGVGESGDTRSRRGHKLHQLGL
jgi:hypothetical protein